MQFAPPENNSFGAGFSQAAQAVAQARYDAARRQELKMRAASQYGGVDQLGSGSSPISLLAPPQPSVPGPMGQAPQVQRTSDEVTAQGALNAANPAPAPQGPPVAAPQAPLMPADVQPAQRPVPQQQAPGVPSQPTPQLSQDAVMQLRRRIQGNLQQFPNVTFRQLAETLGGDTAGVQAARELMGFGPMSPTTISRLIQLGQVSLPDYSGVTGTETLPAQQEAKLQNDFQSSGMRAMGPSMSAQAGPEQSFQQNLEQAGPGVATAIYGDQTRLAGKMRQMDLLAEHYARTSNNQTLGLLQRDLAAAKNPTNGIINPDQLKVAQDRFDLATAAALEGPEQAAADYPQAAQQYPELLKIRNSPGGGFSGGSRGLGGGSPRYDTPEVPTVGGGQRHQASAASGKPNWYPRLKPDEQADYDQMKAANVPDDQLEQAFRAKNPKAFLGFGVKRRK